ncbi:MAG: ferritin, partial [Candidatus Thorarchaeota archaeon]|nr:ferritin [Candidatus Thorarchaeota archaeon]
MGKRGREIVKLDVDELLGLLNKAFADEWLAYYQYWIGAKVAVGPMRGAVVGELMEHAMEELKHAGMLTERIIQLGGTPLLKPSDWDKHTNCGYEAPSDPSVKKLIEQNIEAERCA